MKRNIRQSTFIDGKHIGTVAAASSPAPQELNPFHSPSSPAYRLPYAVLPLAACSYIIGLFLAPAIQSLCENQQQYLLYRLGTRMRNALMAAIYRKCLRLSNAAIQVRRVPQCVWGCKDVWKSGTGCTEDCRRSRCHERPSGVGSVHKEDTAGAVNGVFQQGKTSCDTMALGTAGQGQLL